MFSLDNTCWYWLYDKPVDMRKSFNGFSINIGSIGQKTYNRKKISEKNHVSYDWGQTTSFFWGGGWRHPPVSLKCRHPAAKGWSCFCQRLVFPPPTIHGQSSIEGALGYFMRQRLAAQKLSNRREKAGAQNLSAHGLCRRVI